MYFFYFDPNEDEWSQCIIAHALITLMMILSEMAMTDVYSRQPPPNEKIMRQKKKKMET